MNRFKRLVDNLLVAAIVFIILCYVLSDVFVSHKSWCFPVCGVMGIIIAGVCIIRSKLLASYDAMLLCAFLCLSLISSTLAGVAPLEFLCSRFFSFWMMCLSMYFVVQALPDRKRTIGIFFFFSSLVLCFVSIYAIFHASASILANVLNENMTKGCFSDGRLYALGNANVIGVTSAGHILLSIAGLLEYGKRNRALRIFYLFSAFIGWMTLGLTGCRNGRIAVALTLSMLFFAFLRRNLGREKKKFLLEIALSSFVFAMVLVSDMNLLRKNGKTWLEDVSFIMNKEY